MHDTVKQDYLAQAERHLAKVQERVARQKRIIDGLVQAGGNRARPDLRTPLHREDKPMTSRDLESVAQTLVAQGKGILAADETIPTLTRRFDTLGIRSTEQSRRTYREMLFTSPGAAEFISGVIMYDETIRQKSASGAPLAEALTVEGILPGIKVDTGAKPLAGSPDETVTEGLDGLRDRLREYHGMGARFAKWRAVIHVTDILPSSACVRANAHALARYASLCQEQELVPIVEPEVLMDGSHTIERCEEVTGMVLHAVFRRPLRARYRARRNAAQTQHGSRRQGVRPPSLCGGGRDRDPALLAPARACRGAWNCVPVRRPTSPARDRSSERNQSAARPETLEDQFLLWAGASGSGFGRLAWTRRELAGRPASSLSPGQIQWGGECREVHG